MRKMMLVLTLFLALGLVFGSGLSAKMIHIGEHQIVAHPALDNDSKGFAAALAEEGFIALENLRLQESIIREQTEKEKLEELNELKSEFISRVSHELRTPLSIIMGSIRLVLDEIPGKIAQQQREVLVTAMESVQRLTRLVNSLLDISRIELNPRVILSVRFLTRFFASIPTNGAITL